MKKEKEIISIINNTYKNVPVKVKQNDPFLKKIPFELGTILSKEELALIIPYIQEFGLDDPRKLIKWVVELNFAAIESINAGIEKVRKDLLKEDISMLRAISWMLDSFSKNDNKQLSYEICISKIFPVISDLQGKIEDYLSDIIEIDELPRYKFFLKANFNISKVDSAVLLGKAALEAYFNAIIIFSVIQNEYKVGDSDDFIKFFDFIEGLDISYFLAYDKNKSDFWNKKEMIERIKTAQSNSMTIQEFLLSEQETEVDFEKDINYEN